MLDRPHPHGQMWSRQSGASKCSVTSLAGRERLPHGPTGPHPTRYATGLVDLNAGELGYDRAQVYHLCRPVAADDLIGVLRRPPPY